MNFMLGLDPPCLLLYHVAIASLHKAIINLFSIFHYLHRIITCIILSLFCQWAKTRSLQDISMEFKNLTRKANWGYDEFLRLRNKIFALGHIKPGVYSYNAILGGLKEKYCRYRQFDDIEQDIAGYLGVETKRDNATGFSKAEFFYSVGNGLCLDTESKMFESSLAQALDSAVHTDINSALVRASQQ
ncbi:hypothetical protein ACJX0J_030155, partial [Zea mays]